MYSFAKKSVKYTHFKNNSLWCSRISYHKCWIILPFTASILDEEVQVRWSAPPPPQLNSNTRAKFVILHPLIKKCLHCRVGCPRVETVTVRVSILPKNTMLWLVQISDHLDTVPSVEPLRFKITSTCSKVIVTAIIMVGPMPHLGVRGQVTGNIIKVCLKETGFELLLPLTVIWSKLNICQNSRQNLFTLDTSINFLRIWFSSWCAIIFDSMMPWNPLPQFAQQNNCYFATQCKFLSFR